MQFSAFTLAALLPLVPFVVGLQGSNNGCMAVPQGENWRNEVEVKPQRDDATGQKLWFLQNDYNGHDYIFNVGIDKHNRLDVVVTSPHGDDAHMFKMNIYSGMGGPTSIVVGRHTSCYETSFTAPTLVDRVTVQQWHK